MFSFEEITNFPLTLSSILSRSLCFGTIDSFMAGLCKNQVKDAYCSAQTTHQLVQVWTTRRAILVVLD